MNRGSVDSMAEKAKRAVDASMRPRFMNRGSEDILSVLSESQQASMRPRFMNRGSVRVDASDEDRLLASMRPRFMNRGSIIDPVKRTRAGQLQ